MRTILILFLVICYLPGVIITFFGDSLGLGPDLIPEAVAPMLKRGLVVMGALLAAMFALSYDSLKAKARTTVYGFLAVVLWLSFFSLSNPKVVVNDAKPDVNPAFCHYISETAVLDLPGTPITELIEHVGAPTYYENPGRYVFDYLTIVSNDGRHRGIGFMVGGDGTILDLLPLPETEFSSNWFCHLPLFSTLAANNLFNSAYSSDDKDMIRWWNPLIMLLLFGFALLSSIRFVASLIIVLGANGIKVPALPSGILYVAYIIAIYCFSLPFLNVAHSIWLIGIFLYVDVAVFAAIWGKEKAPAALKKCPKCGKLDCYKPRKVILDRELLHITLHNPLNYVRSESAASRATASKTLLVKEWHCMEGECKKCGYVDTNKYWTEKEEELKGGICPKCSAALDINRSDIRSGTGSQTRRDISDPKIDLSTAENLGGRRVRGEITRQQQVLTGKWVSFVYSEHCQACGYSYGPKLYTRTFTDSENREVRERGEGRLKY